MVAEQSKALCNISKLILDAPVTLFSTADAFIIAGIRILNMFHIQMATSYFVEWFCIQMASEYQKIFSGI